MGDAADRLRQLLNPAIGGPDTDALLEALAVGDDYNSADIQAVHDQLYIISANGKYLDKVAANVGFLRPAGIGLSDDAFRGLAIAVTADKQIPSILMQILEVFFGPETTRADMTCLAAEPYALSDGMQLVLEFDSAFVATVTFRSSDFSSISAATAKEISDVISKQLHLIGGLETWPYAEPFFDNDTSQTFVRVTSGIRSPLSAVRCIGGKAQEILQFPSILSTTQNIGTSWNISNPTASTIRFTWDAGTDPTLSLVQEGDTVNIFGSVFPSADQGYFTITSAVGGPVGTAYFEIENQFATIPVTSIVQTAANDLTFNRPTKFSVLSDTRYATIFEVAPGVLNVFLPATTQVVARNLIGAAHLRNDWAAGPPYAPPLIVDNRFPGPYIYDTTQSGVLTKTSTVTTSLIEAGQTYRVLEVSDASDFPDAAGYLMFEYGTDRQEGPVRYIGRPGSAILLVDPSWSFRFSHPTNSDVTLLSSRSPIDLSPLGLQYPFYLTGTAEGRVYAENLIDTLVATGLTLIITIIYPGDVGLGNSGKPTSGTAPFSDAVYVWGP